MLVVEHNLVVDFGASNFAIIEGLIYGNKIEGV